MLIFDGFPSRKHAEDFAQQATETFGRTAQVFDNQEDSDAVDPFPWGLQPPIVLVERNDDNEVETALEIMVKRFSGSFAGT